MSKEQLKNMKKKQTGGERGRPSKLWLYGVENIFRNSEVRRPKTKGNIQSAT